MGSIICLKKNSTYSCWPIVLVPYNLPPSLCMSGEYSMLTLLIPGPKQPGMNIDVYLQPLIDDLIILWKGVHAFDAYKKEMFQLRAMVIWTIHDYPAYGNIAGCATKGYKGCVVCGDDTSSIYLKHSRKNVYLGHRRFLPSEHPFRSDRKSFIGKEDNRPEPKPLDGTQVLQKIQETQKGFQNNQNTGALVFNKDSVSKNTTKAKTSTKKNLKQPKFLKMV